MSADSAVVRNSSRVMVVRGIGFGFGCRKLCKVRVKSNWKRVKYREILFGDKDIWRYLVRLGGVGMVQLRGRDEWTANS